MSVEIVQARLDACNCQSVREEENAIREIAQEIVLGGLSRAGFFKKAAFQGGTCLRILYGLERFSEDLDFVLMAQEKSFQLGKYLAALAEELRVYGFIFETAGREDAEKAVQKQFLKDDSLVRLITFKHFKPGRDVRSVRIKIEIDTNPPGQGRVETKYHDYPFAYDVTVQDLPTLFASKFHALLCRGYVKGRDWYDFLWYVCRKTGINFSHLTAAIDQIGPWKGKGIRTDKIWCLKELGSRIREIDWNKAKSDVMPFIKPKEVPSIEIWSTDFFLDRLEKLAQILS